MSKPTIQRLKRLESVTNTISAATTNLSSSKNAQMVLRTTVATAQTINLPAATGKGGKFNIFIGVTATGNKVIKAPSGSVIQGIAAISATTSGTFGSAANTNTITLNGTTTAGIIGTMVELSDVAAGVYAVVVNGVGSGTAATCFSNT